MQIHKYNYTNTNTQIQLRSKLQIDLTCAIFLKRYWYEDLKNNVPHVSDVQIHKYKYTNAQIQHMTKYQKDPTSYS